VCGGDGVAMFDALHRRHKAGDAILYAFDLLEFDGEDFRLVLAWQPKFGVDEIAGGAVSGCADAFVAAAIIVAPTMIQGRMTTS
jgi:hypothetical protein